MSNKYMAMNGFHQLSIVFKYLCEKGVSLRDLSESIENSLDANNVSEDAELLETIFEGFEAIFNQKITFDRLRRITPFIEGKVLDFGCGLGGLSLPVAEHSNGVVLVDSNSLKVDILRDNYKSDKVKIEAEIPNQKFDVILCINVLDHISAGHEYISKFYDLLNDEGRLILYAHYTNDGIHISDEASKDEVFKSLTEHFRKEEFYENLHVWKKKKKENYIGLSGMNWGRHAFRLISKPNVKLHKTGVKLYSSDFYTKSVLLSAHEYQLLPYLDGKHLISDILSIIKLSKDQVENAILKLYKAKYLSITEPCNRCNQEIHGEFRFFSYDLFSGFSTTQDFRSECERVMKFIGVNGSSSIGDKTVIAFGPLSKFLKVGARSDNIIYYDFIDEYKTNGMDSAGEDLILLFPFYYLNDLLLETSVSDFFYILKTRMRNGGRAVFEILSPTISSVSRTGLDTRDLSVINPSNGKKIIAKSQFDLVLPNARTLMYQSDDNYELYKIGEHTTQLLSLETLSYLSDIYDFEIKDVFSSYEREEYSKGSDRIIFTLEFT